MAQEPRVHFYSANDGLRLAARDWAAPDEAMPVVCLPGLARTALDFDALARRLVTRRRVVALDYRGRGDSEHDRDYQNYDLRVENADILTVLTAMDIDRAIVIGTSRGGLHAMLLAATRPTLLHAVVLNDIGPVIEATGLARIRGYVGKLPAPGSWAEARAIVRRVLGGQFTAIDDAGVETYARQTFMEKNGHLVPRYDPRLMKTLEGLDLSVPVPTAWPQFDGLQRIPVLALRGENSDLLSPATLEEMARRHPGLETHVVPGEGHAPLLLDDATIDRIVAFVEQVDRLA